MVNELITDLKSIELETLNNLKMSKATNTIRAYKSDFKDFGIFCAQNGHVYKLFAHTFF